VRWSFTPEPTVPGVVRRRLVPVLARWGVAAEDGDTALLVINELVSNAVEHAETLLTLKVSSTGAAVLVEVGDGARTEPRLQPVDYGAVRGRGLQFVDALARHWGWTMQPGGKTVWAEIACVVRTIPTVR
jgi:anti-sigma regulatory factor (Ser/Thr protein kinase)